MSGVYDVYEHPTKGAWGVSVQGMRVLTAEIAGGIVRQATLLPHNLAPEVSKRVRAGFKKITRRKYLQLDGEENGLLKGRFTEDHPELAIGEELIFFTTVSIGDDVAALAQQWEAVLEATDVRPEALEAWLTRVRRACQYIAVPASHPAIALVVADWVVDGRRMLISDRPGVPQRVPKEVPLEWEEWLAYFFTKQNETRDALVQLGWSVRDAMFANQAIASPNSGDDGGWLADAASVAF